MIQWNTADEEAALKEGWNIWECSGSSLGQWQLQKHDDAERFEDDAAAWLFVLLGAEMGSALCVKALKFLCERNPQEYDAILKAGGRT